VRESAGTREKARGHAGNVGSLFTSMYAYRCSYGHYILSSISGRRAVKTHSLIPLGGRQSLQLLPLFTYKITKWRESASELH
jgi:hypothetical protein